MEPVGSGLPGTLLHNWWAANHSSQLRRQHELCFFFYFKCNCYKNIVFLDVCVCLHIHMHTMHIQFSWGLEESTRSQNVLSHTVVTGNKPGSFARAAGTTMLAASDPPEKAQDSLQDPQYVLSNTSVF